LTFNVQSSFSKLIGERCLINRFKEAWAKGGVDLEGAVNDYLGYFILGHGAHAKIHMGSKTRTTTKTFSHAKTPRAQRVRVPFSKTIKILNDYFRFCLGELCALA
jgi:hypothetical protein